MPESGCIHLFSTCHQCHSKLGTEDVVFNPTETGLCNFSHFYLRSILCFSYLIPLVPSICYHYIKALRTVCLKLSKLLMQFSSYVSVFSTLFFLPDMFSAQYLLILSVFIFHTFFDELYYANYHYHFCISSISLNEMTKPSVFRFLKFLFSLFLFFYYFLLYT